MLFRALIVSLDYLCMHLQINSTKYVEKRCFRTLNLGSLHFACLQWPSILLVWSPCVSSFEYAFQQSETIIVPGSVHFWMMEGDRTGRSISKFKNYLTVNHGLNDVAKKICIQKFTVEISIRRCKKEPQFPNGRVLARNKQDEWLIYRDFLKDRKEHELIGEYCLMNFIRWKICF